MQINLQEIRDSFITTSRDLLQKSEALLLEMEKSPEPHHFAELLRSIHTIKGNAGIFELDSVIKLCHALETRLEAIKKTGKAFEPGFVDLGLMGLDRIQLLINSMDDKQKQAQVDFESVVQKLEIHSNPANIPKAENATTSENTGVDWIKNKTQKIKLPDKYFDLAKKENSYLTFLVLDLGAQGKLTLTALHEKLQILNTTHSLLTFGILRKDARLVNDAPTFMPYFLILNTKDPVEKLIQKLDLQIILYHYFWQPPQSQKPDHFQEAVETLQKETSPDLNVKETHLKVHLDLLNNLIDITGEIVLTRNALVRKIDQAGDQSLVAFAKKLSQLVTDLQDKVMKTRLQSLGILFHRFPRLVRETAMHTNKKATLHIQGGEIEIDKAIIDEIADPLVHIIRNAVDHGLESPAERLHLGKPETGNITLTAEMREGNIVVTITDDGQGLDLERIKNTAVSKGLVTRELASMASAQDVAEYLFLPGFSTKSEVTTISGRGVGMDVVKTNMSRIGGSVEITGTMGKGTVVTLIIPQTLSIIASLVVEIAGRRFVIPQQNIVELVMIEPEKLKIIQDNDVYELRDKLLPIIKTGKLLGMSESAIAPPFIIVVKTEKYNYGITIDRVIDSEEIVVKPIPLQSKEKQYFSGAAIMGDGEIALILDIAAMAKQANLQPNIKTIKDAHLLASATTTTGMQYLLVEVAGNRAAMPIHAFPRIERIPAENIEEIMGRKIVRYRNEIIPVVNTDFLVRSSTNAQIAKVITEYFLVIFKSEGEKYGILAEQIIDITGNISDVRKEQNAAAGISGYTIINDHTTVVLDMTTLSTEVLRNNQLSAPAVSTGVPA